MATNGEQLEQYHVVTELIGIGLLGREMGPEQHAAPPDHGAQGSGDLLLANARNQLLNHGIPLLLGDPLVNAAIAENPDPPLKE